MTPNPSLEPGPPPAWHLAREPVVLIIGLAGQAPYRFRPLSSNVRPHRERQSFRVAAGPTKPIERFIATPEPGRRGEVVLFAVLFTDKPGHGEMRTKHLQAHIEWVDEHKDKVLVAGSLRQELGDTPKGGLWVVDAESKAAVFELMKSDPFYTCGLRQGVEVLHWSKALQHHRTLV